MIPIPFLKIGMWAASCLVAGVVGAGIAHYAGRAYKKMNEYLTRKNLAGVVSENLKTGNYAECDIGLSEIEIAEINVERGTTFVSLELVDEAGGVDEMYLCTDKGTSLVEGERLELSH